MRTEEFRAKAVKTVDKILSEWGNGVSIGQYGERRFRITSSHSWGTAYCDWSWIKDDLFTALKEIGAVNIKGRVGFNYVDIYFDMRKSLMDKEVI